MRTVVFVSDATDNEKDQDPARQAEGEARLAALRAAVTLVVRIKAMHQKILVIDEAITFLGSLNTLSHSQRRPRREIMVRHRGARYAKRILEHERANMFATPPKCPQCNALLELRRSANTRRNRPWEWVCATHSRSVRQAIPDDKPSRS